jgi:hypothetical protein
MSLRKRRRPRLPTGNNCVARSRSPGGPEASVGSRGHTDAARGDLGGLAVAENVEVIEVSASEYRRAREAALKELGLTYRELAAQARTGRFSSLLARKLWLIIGNA